MSSSSIALRVYGGSLEGGLNPTPIVSVGEVFGNFAPFTPALVTEDRSWSIIHGQDYTAYTLYTKEYPTSDGQPGQLQISLLLPPTLLLANGVSPLEILNAALNLFHGKVPVSPIDDGDFYVLLDRYMPLVERASPLPVMNGLSVASFIPKDLNQLSALMRYSRYPVLEAVKRLELGMNCESTIALPIPSGKPKVPLAPQAQQASPSPASQKKTNKTKVIKRKTQDEGAGQTDARDIEPMHNADSNRVPANTSEKKKNGVLTAALILGAIAVAAALLYFLWPKDKETAKDKPNTEQTSPNENANQPSQDEMSDESSMDEEGVADNTTEENGDQVNATTNTDSKTAKTPQGDEGGKTTDTNNASSKTTSQMSKTTAIGILLSGQGDIAAARNALTPQERNDIEVIRTLNNKISQDNRKSANQVINQLKAGSLTIASAKAKMQELAKDTTPKMSRKEALEIVFGNKEGDVNAAYTVFTPQEKKDIIVINSYKKNYKSGLFRPTGNKIKNIINNVISGSCSISSARQQIEEIINGKK